MPVVHVEIDADRGKVAPAQADGLAVRDDPVFAEHWADRRAIVVRIEADQIVIRPDDR